jgi:hypothetical protein
VPRCVGVDSDLAGEDLAGSIRVGQAIDVGGQRRVAAFDVGAHTRALVEHIALTSKEQAQEHTFPLIPG